MMKNPRARRKDIVTETLAAETIVYDQTNHRAHSLNRTVALVWASADGQKSVEAIAGILHRETGIPEDRNVVLLALEELSTAGLLETPATEGAGPALMTRRQLARRLAMAGVTAAALPLVATVLAPTPAMASSGGVSQAQAGSDLSSVTREADSDFWYYLDPTAQADLKAAQNAYNSGNYTAEIADLDGVLKALGLPPM